MESPDTLNRRQFLRTTGGLGLASVPAVGAGSVVSGVVEASNHLFVGRTTAGWISIDMADEDTARNDRLTLQELEDDDFARVVGEPVDDGTWESNAVHFPVVEAEGGITADITAPDGFTGELDRDGEFMTMEGPLEVVIGGNESTAFSFTVSATTGESGALTGSAEFSDGTGTATLVDNEFVIEDETDNGVVNQALNLPSEESGRNWFELELDVEFNVAEDDIEDIETETVASDGTATPTPTETDESGGVAGNGTVTQTDSPDSSLSDGNTSDGGDDGPPDDGDTGATSESTDDGFLSGELLAVGGGVSLVTLAGGYTLFKRRRQSEYATPPSTTGPSATDTPIRRTISTASSSIDDIASASGVSDLSRADSRGPLAMYTGQYDPVAGPVQVGALDPEYEPTEAIEQAFQQSLDGWRNGSSHPNVCTVHDWGTDPRPWVVVEFPPGDRLSECLDRLDVIDVANVVVTTAEAVRNVALYNTYHLNLSPHCVWVGGGEGGPHGVVEDWGLERALREAHAETHVTSYTAPEQLDERAVGKRTDVYGLGAVAYHALTGDPPVEADADAIANAEIRPPSDRGDVPPALDEPVMRALEANPADRYDSAYDFGRALERSL